MIPLGVILEHAVAYMICDQSFSVIIDGDESGSVKAHICWRLPLEGKCFDGIVFGAVSRYRSNNSRHLHASVVVSTVDLPP
jgi:hypothetical protein